MACPAPHCREALSSNEVTPLTAALIILMDVIEGLGASGRPAEHRPPKRDGQMRSSVILTNIMARKLPNVELRAHCGAREK